MVITRPLACGISLLFLAAVTGAAAPEDQIPREFRNLQVLPKTIGRAELVQLMRQIASDLGVRCTTCHVGPENLEGMDFATDERPMKQIARNMLKMVETINSQYISAVPDRGRPRQTVSCATCHRRSAVPPRPLAALLLETIEKDGIAAAVELHRRLRDELLDSGLYDFRQHTLNQVATRLREQGKLADAIVILKRNADLFPKSLTALTNVADTALLIPDAALAEEYYKKALAIDPKHEPALLGLASIKRYACS